MLEVNGIRKVIGGKIILNDIHLKMKKGSIHAVLGNNGAGKTTLLKSIIGIYKCDEGTVKWNNQRIHENTFVKSKIYMVQDEVLYHRSDTIHSVVSVHRAMYPSWSDDYFNRLCRLIDIPIEVLIKTLSKGQKGLLSIVIALACKPELLVLDEPFNELDPVARKLARKLIIDEVADRNLSVLISSHDLNDLEEFCDTISLIHQSEVKYTQDLDSIKSSIHKVRLSTPTEELYDLSSLAIITHEKNSFLDLLVVRGSITSIEEQLIKLRPSFYEILPLTLEELFIYEMEGYDYAFKAVN